MYRVGGACASLLRAPPTPLLFFFPFSLVCWWCRCSSARPSLPTGLVQPFSCSFSAPVSQRTLYFIRKFRLYLLAPFGRPPCREATSLLHCPSSPLRPGSVAFEGDLVHPPPRVQFPWPRPRPPVASLPLTLLLLAAPAAAVCSRTFVQYQFSVINKKKKM